MSENGKSELIPFPVFVMSHCQSCGSPFEGVTQDLLRLIADGKLLLCLQCDPDAEKSSGITAVNRPQGQ